MDVLSFDCGSKALGVCIIRYNSVKVILAAVAKCIENIRKLDVGEPQYVADFTKYVGMLSKWCDSAIQLRFADVVDLAPGQKLEESTSYDRACRLRGYLVALTTKFNLRGLQSQSQLHVFIEDQNTNRKSSEIYFMIEQFFAKIDSSYDSCELKEKAAEASMQGLDVNVGVAVHKIGASLKNTIHFGPGLEHSHFITKYAANYTANKAHCKANMQYFLQIFGKTHLIENIPKSKLKDASDAFMQAVARCCV